MVDKNLMSIDQVAEVSDTDMMYTVRAGTSDARVSVGQLRDTVAKTVNGEVGDITLKAGTNVGIETTGVGEITINNELPSIRTPIPVSPLTGAVDVSVTPTLAAGVYGNVYGVTRQYREFQVDVIGGDFSNPIRTFQVDSDVWVVDPELLDDAQFKWRCRDFDTEGNVSGYSDVQTFTTVDIYIITPVVEVPVNGGTLAASGEPIKTGSFVIVNADDQHYASYWKIKNSVGAVVFETGRDVVNLTEWQPPAGIFLVGGEYTVEVVYESNKGFVSDVGSSTFTVTAATYDSILAVGFNTFAGQYNHYVYGQDVDTFNLLPPSTATGNCSSLAFSPDGKYMVIAVESSRGLFFYYRDGNNFTELPNPATMPTGAPRGVAFSPDGTHLAVCHDTTPFLTIYKRNGDTFTKLPNPASLPASAGRGASFSPDGVHLAITITTSPFLTIYKRNGDTFTKLPNPTSIPVALAWGCHFASNGYLYVGQNESDSMKCYSVVGDTFTNVPIISPAIGLPMSISSTVDGSFVAYSASSTGCCILKNVNGTFTHVQTLPNPSYAVSFSRDGNYLCTGGYSASEYLAVYKKDAGLDTYSKIVPSPTAPTPVAPGSVSFYPSSLYPNFVA